MVIVRQRAVTTAEARGRPVLLTAWSAPVLADYAAKGLLDDRRAKRVVSAVCRFSTLSLGLLDLDRRHVQPVSVDPADVPRDPAALALHVDGTREERRRPSTTRWARRSPRTRSSS